MKSLISSFIILVSLGMGTAFGQAVLFQESFNSNLGTFTAASGSGGNWVWTSSCAASNLSGHSAPGAALFQGSGCLFGNGGLTVSGNLNSQPYALPALGGLVTSLSANFNYFISNECGTGGYTCYYDVLYFEISVNGGVSWTTLGSSQNGPLITGSVWRAATFSLNAYAGQTALFRFRFNSLDGIANDYDGIYVDDFNISATCNGAPTTFSFTAAPYANTPVPLPVNYTIANLGQSFTATLTFKLYTVGGVLASTQSTTVAVANNTVNGVYNLSTVGIAPGYYILYVEVTARNACQLMQTFTYGPSTIMLLALGQTPCVVWPGDVNRDDIVNFGDRNDLNNYMRDGGLNPLWRSGPARFNAAAASNPMVMIAWVAQAAVPWATPEGCHMDTDGNGTVNNFDYLAIKVNWLRFVNGVPKSSTAFNPATFDLDQNHPNPFNPTTTIQYSVPEQSQVHLVVTDMAGRTIATLVDGSVDSGIHTAQFHAGNMESGHYFATIRILGQESGLTYSKSIKMTLTK